MQSSFFSSHKNRAVLESVRLATAISGKGQFISDQMNIGPEKYLLTQNLEGPYFQPVNPSDRSVDGTWIPNVSGLRKKSEIQNLFSKIEIERSEMGFRIHFNVSGTDRVPPAIELGSRKDGRLSHTEPVSGIENAYFLLDGQGEYTGPFNDRIRFGPGYHQHRWTQLRGVHPERMLSPFTSPVSHHSVTPWKFSKVNRFPATGI